MSNRTYPYSRVRRRRKRRVRIKRCVLIISGAALFILFICGIISLTGKTDSQQTVNKAKTLPKITIDTQLLVKNKFSRPGLALNKINGIVVHYTANPKTDAEDNRNYFNNLPKINKKRETPIYASSHFIVGLEGQIVQCIPLNEISYASNERNGDTISVECCHRDKSGKFNDITYKALVELLAYLCLKFDLQEEDIIRHYDVTGKLCPLYYVKNESEWLQLRNDVKRRKQSV